MPPADVAPKAHVSSVNWFPDDTLPEAISILPSRQRTIVSQEGWLIVHHCNVPPGSDPVLVTSTSRLDGWHPWPPHERPLSAQRPESSSAPLPLSGYEMFFDDRSTAASWISSTNARRRTWKNTFSRTHAPSPKASDPPQQALAPSHAVLLPSFLGQLSMAS
jgi:hypothetical protein